MAISKTNILDKLCFVVFGGGLNRHSEALRARLFDYHKYSGTEGISAQTIRYWFEKNSKPTRQPAFQFIYEFIGHEIDYASLTADRKKVFTQIETFLRAALAYKPVHRAPDAIYMSSKGVIVINVGNTPIGRDESISGALSGIYRTYRIRLSENGSAPIAGEVLRIFRRNKELRFEHWYKRQGVQLSRFEGVVFSVGDVMWFIGSSADEGNRLRVMNFRFLAGTSARYNEVRWGLLTSNINVPSRSDPAACRILLVKERGEVSTYSAFVRDHVRPMKPDDMDVSEQKRAIIQRLIDNQHSAVSEHGSVEPIHKGASGESPDMILKVNQSTLEIASDRMSLETGV